VTVLGSTASEAAPLVGVGEDTPDPVVVDVVLVLEFVVELRSIC
jgi:hypothetical protein